MRGGDALRREMRRAEILVRLDQPDASQQRGPRRHGGDLRQVPGLEKDGGVDHGVHAGL
jgi:hypothetical protein